MTSYATKQAAWADINHTMTFAATLATGSQRILAETVRDIAAKGQAHGISPDLQRYAESCLTHLTNAATADTAFATLTAAATEALNRAMN